MLVRPVGTPDIQELEDKIDCWIAGVHDAAVVSQWCAVWSVCDSAAIQHPSYRPAAMLLCVVWCQLGAVFDIQSVSRANDISLSITLTMLTELRTWRTWTASLLLFVLLVAFAGIEVGLVYAIRTPYSNGLEWPVLLIGIIAFLTLISGYMPIPFELLKRRGRVVGIDFIFLAIDWNGAFFSLMALVAQNEFDVLFGTMYALW
jgi:hypothetical protein